MARAAKVMQTLKQDPVKAVKSVKGLFNRDLAWEQSGHRVWATEG